MNPHFFRIAATKTTDPDALSMLSELAQLAHALVMAEATFPERINANKAKRGERPTKLPRKTTEMLDALAKDQIDTDRDVCEAFANAGSPSEILASAAYALEQDIPNAKQLLKYYHPDDLSLGEELLALKVQLLGKATAFLERYPDQ